jgi:hypothetical protein
MTRSEAVRKSLIQDLGAYNMESYRKLKRAFNLPDARPSKKVTSPSKSGKIISDRERVKKIQKNNNNYKGNKP